jgi:hypothetical protein
VRVTGVATNLPVADIVAARGFYADYLGLNWKGSTLDGWRASSRQTARCTSSS